MPQGNVFSHLREVRLSSRSGGDRIAKVYELKVQGKGVTDIAKEMNIARSSVYRALKERREKGLRQGSERPCQISDGSKRREQPLLQRGESAPQLYEGELVDKDSAATMR
jgi:transposase